MNNSINPAEASTSNTPEFGGIKDAALALTSLGSLTVAETLHTGSTEQYAVGGSGALLGAYVLYRAYRYFK